MTMQDIADSGQEKTGFFSDFSQKKVLDKYTGIYSVKIFSGDCYVTDRKDEMLATILGSCVSACIRDPEIGVGGMNHFLLPGDENMETASSPSNRYGAFAMESLINGIIRMGGRKERLEIKVFGGGNVAAGNSQKIGTRNADFVRAFLKSEGYRVVAEDLDGDLPRRVHYYPSSGNVMVRRLQKKGDELASVNAEEDKYRQRIILKPVEGDIDLF